MWAFKMVVINIEVLSHYRIERIAVQLQDKAILIGAALRTMFPGNSHLVICILFNMQQYMMKGTL